MRKLNILAIYRSNKTVFTFKDLSLILSETNRDYLKKMIYRYVKAGKLYPLRRGIYAKDRNYNKLELATKIYTPSYVSFETVLTKAGVIFQYYSKILVASYLSREIVVDNQTYSYKKVKDAILTNQAGIENKENYSVASPERAFLDILYLYKDYHFDNLSSLDWKKVYKILSNYGGDKSMKDKVKRYYEAAKNKN